MKSLPESCAALRMRRGEEIKGNLFIINENPGFVTIK